MAIVSKLYQDIGASQTLMELRTDPGISIDPQSSIYVMITWDDAIATEAAVDASAALEGLIPAPAGVGGSLPTGYVDGLETNPRLGADSAQVGPGSCRSDDDTFDIVVAATLTVDITVVGPGGRDSTSPDASNTWYAIYVIADSTAVNPVALIMSTSFVAPTMPAGYDKYRRVGCTRNGPSGNLLRGKQIWNGRTRRYVWEENDSLLDVLIDGASAGFSNVDVTSLVPTTARGVLLRAGFTTGAGGAATDGLFLQRDGAPAVTSGLFLSPGIVTAQKTSWEVFINRDAGGHIEYKVSDGVNNLADLYVLGFDDEI